MAETEKGSVVGADKPETLRPSGNTQPGNRSTQLGQQYERYVGGIRVSDGAEFSGWKQE